MTERALGFTAAVVAFLMATGAQAKCPGETQMEMNSCAYDAWQSADSALNGAYRIAIAKAREMDSLRVGETMQRRVGNAESQKLGTEDALRAAQRAWIIFRDNACLVDSDLVYGGSLQPLLYAACMEDLTTERTKQLTQFGEFD